MYNTSLLGRSNQLTRICATSPLFFQEQTQTMNKALLSTFAAALILSTATTASAANGISGTTLSDMGLSGLTVMSDSDAMAIRGKGFGGCDLCGHRKDSSSVAFGNSFATISLDCPDCAEGTAHSENGYAAEGSFAASGDNFSEAGAEVIKVEVMVIDGSTTSLTTTLKARVFAGGFSSARSF
jgi:hypothetical protein